MSKKVPSSKLNAFALNVSSHVLASLFAFFLTTDNFAQAVLLKDINAAEETTLNEYKELTHGVSQIYFISNGNELWKSDGTAGATTKLRSFVSLSTLTMAGNTLYFVADDGLNGLELWKSDGTTTGTRMVKDIRGGKFSSQPSWLTNVNGTLYFSANNGTNGFELWRSDGTGVTTVMVKDIRPGSYLSSLPRDLTNVNGVLFFSAADAAGRELWKSDGTAAGTAMVKDINTSTAINSSPQHLTNVNGTLFFSAIDNTSGRELWKSNGTSAGTVRVKDIRTGSVGSGVENLINVNNTLFFTADNGINGDELCKSNGTSAGTVLVKDLNPGSAGSNNTSSAPHGMGNFTSISGRLYFTASKGSQDYIYRSDGTASGTVVIQPIATANGNTGRPGITYPDPAFTLLNGYVFYFNSVEGPDADLSGGGAWYHLWKIPFDGTVPQKVKSLFRTPDTPEKDAGITQEMIAFNNNLYLNGRLTAAGGIELIRSDGTTSGTTLVKDVFTYTKGSNIRQMISSENIVYMLDGLNNSKSLYRTDGTPAGTYLLRSDVIKMAKAGNTIFFVAGNSTTGYQLWKTQGTTATNLQLKVLNGLPEEMIDVNGVLYFHTGLGRLWRSNGTSAGTTQVATSPVITKLYPSEDRVFIVSDRAAAGLDLLKYQSGVLSLVKAIRTGGNSTKPTSYPYATLNHIFYFVANDGLTGNELWRSDGTNSGTYRVIDVNSYDYATSAGEPGLEALQIFKNRLYISASLDNYDGLFYLNEYGTLTFVAPGYITQMATNSYELFFWFEEEFDRTFWFRSSDGEPTNAWVQTGVARTRTPVDYTLINETLFFAAESSPHLIRYDTDNQCGAYFVTGTDGAYPLESLGNNLVFIGATPATGDEPFVYYNIISVYPCGPPPALALRQDTEDESDATNAKVVTSFPNPFTTSFKLHINSDDDMLYDVEIFTNTGLPVEKLSALKANTDYDNIGETWKPGVYIARIKTASGIMNELIIKK